MERSNYMPHAQPGQSRFVWTAWLVSTVAIFVVIGVLTLTPTPHMPRGNLHWDKLAHLLAFMVLVFPTAALWPRVTALVGVLAVGYGAAIEVIQPYAGRSAEFADLLADGIGVGLGLILGASLRRVVISRRMARAR